MNQSSYIPLDTRVSFARLGTEINPNEKFEKLCLHISLEAALLKLELLHLAYPRMSDLAHIIETVTQMKMSIGDPRFLYLARLEIFIHKQRIEELEQLLAAQTSPEDIEEDIQVLERISGHERKLIELTDREWELWDELLEQMEENDHNLLATAKWEDARVDQFAKITENAENLLISQKNTLSKLFQREYLAIIQHEVLEDTIDRLATEIRHWERKYDRDVTRQVDENERLRSYISYVKAELRDKMIALAERKEYLAACRNQS